MRHTRSKNRPHIQGTVPVLCQMQKNTLRGSSNYPHFQARCVQQDVQTHIVTLFLVRKPVLRHCESAQENILHHHTFTIKKMPRQPKGQQKKLESAASLSLRGHSKVRLS